MIQVQDNKVTITIDVRFGDIVNEINNKIENGEGIDGEVFADWAKEHIADYEGWLRLALISDATQRVADLYVDEVC